MVFLAIWKCSCGHETLIPPSDLQGIAGHQKGMPRDVVFVDFVCPQCGLGTRRYLRDIPEQRFLSAVRYRLPLFHVDLKCVVQNCEAHTTVHTQAESGKPTAEPKIPVPNWKLVGISCYYGHPIKVPLDRKGASRVTNPAGDE
jgi:hypothetical protein